MVEVIGASWAGNPDLIACRTCRKEGSEGAMANSRSAKWILHCQRDRFCFAGPDN